MEPTEEQIIEYLNKLDNYDFLKIVKLIAERRLEENQWSSISNLMLNGSSGQMERELLQVHYALRDIS